jgi:hypothetical protein
MRHITNRKAKWILAGLCLTACLLVLSGHEAASAKDVQAKAGLGAKIRPTGPEPIPKELLAEFIIAAKKTPEYQLCKAMELNDELRETIKQWEKELGLQMTLRNESFLGELWYRYRGGKRKMLDVAPGRFVMLRREQGRYVLECRREDQSRARGTAYEVTARQLGELDLKFPEALHVLDPANAPLETFRVREKNLLSVVEGLCQMGKLDFSIRTDLVSNAYVSLELHGRTVADCLELAGRAAGFRVTYGPLRRRYGGAPLEAESRPSNAIAWWLDDALKLQSDPNTGKPSKKPIEILREEVFREGKKLLDSRPVMVLEPISETRKAAGEK